jgi:hypothetical protein
MFDDFFRWIVGQLATEHFLYYLEMINFLRLILFF